jgi:hypothetical protein
MYDIASKQVQSRAIEGITAWKTIY